MAEAEAKMKQFNGGGAGLDAERGRFPYCVVWTPIPVLTQVRTFLSQRQGGDVVCPCWAGAGPGTSLLLLPGGLQASVFYLFSLKFPPQEDFPKLLTFLSPAGIDEESCQSHWASRWLFPIIGHMGICTSTGVIRDFAGPYFVSEDNMAFGKPVKYWKLDPSKVYSTGPNAWDTAVHDASEEYKHRMHNLCCDNCHSHVALALNLMRYDNSTSWNMVKLCFFSLLYGKYVSLGGFVKTWLPFLLFLGVIVTIVLTLHLR
ncbi:transmembrane protein 222 isoform X1 [Apus apus]|uniref:transmembrane protein 222 isoform X1 n=1 Tax=Apus apus TaxID=8895 RepID=UPI0021F91B02|nr:transmembrane protein 222 isoform X1 [Apus apus]